VWLLVLLIAALVLSGTVLYWLLILSEGAYLGPRLVAFLYDLSATSYDRIKDFDSAEEAYFLGRPLQVALSRRTHPLVLDVATGTGRLPLALLRQPDFDGCVVGLDLSWQMLSIAQRKAMRYGPRAVWIHQDAARLPFGDETFDAVTCIEAVEFLPSPKAALREMVRLLRPGGVLLITNRVGLSKLVLPGRVFSRRGMERFLTSLGLTAIETRPWQDYYEQVWARKLNCSRLSILTMSD
jgi:ubiquinone/menaquinone biosynthesis C-methylase UbiE